MLRFFSKSSKNGKSAKTGKTGRTGRTGKAKIPAGASRRVFHGVSIQADPIDCCRAADAIRNERFLADEAPLLPLAGCSQPQECRCRYQHYDDRRTDSRRESDVGLPVKDHPQDARNGAGRRVTDG